MAMASGLVAETKRVERLPEVIVSRDPFAAAGAILVEGVREVLRKRRRVRLAIPGGSALRAATAARAGLGDAWQQVALTWTDERCVPFDDVDSNYGAAARLDLCATVGAAPGGIELEWVLPLYLDGESPSQAVERAEAGLSMGFDGKLDIVLLGMGADGHVASLFPSLESPRAGMVAHVANSPKPPADRMTLTRRALATADRVVLVAGGIEKREALSRLVEGNSGLPAQGLEGLVIVTDLEGIGVEEIRDVE